MALRGTKPYERWVDANVVRGVAKGTVSAMAWARLGDITTDQFRALAVDHPRARPRRPPHQPAEHLLPRPHRVAAAHPVRPPRRHRHGPARRRAGPRRGGLPRGRHLQPGRDPVPRPGRRHRRRARGSRPGRGGRGAHQHLRLHQLVRPAPRRRHRLLRGRAPGPRPGRPRATRCCSAATSARSRCTSAQKALRLPARNAPEATVRVVRRFADERQAGETFRGWIERSGGVAAIAEDLKDLDQFPTPDDGPGLLRRLRRDRALRRRDRRIGVRHMTDTATRDETSRRHARARPTTSPTPSWPS